MNNHRNNNRRRRSGNRHQGGSNAANRIDSRARGNAPQLLDKYKKLAQDAQHNGDRVQAEYYLQFADHYFRVIADNKARQDEARAKRDEDRDHQHGDGQRDNQRDNPRDNQRDNPRDAQRDEGEEDDRRTRRNPRQRRDTRRDTREHGNAREQEGVIGQEGEFGGEDNAPRARASEQAESRPPVKRTRTPRKPREEAASEVDAESKPPVKRTRAPRKPKEDSADKAEIDAAVLPPAIGADADADAPKKKPAVRRRRKPSEDSDAVRAAG